MASRIIHIIVGLRVAEQITLTTPDRFFFGNILPDCVDSPGGRNGRKAYSHFWDYNTDQKTKGQNWQLFWDKYRNHERDELYLGYVCHLVTDAVWVQEIITYLPKESRHLPSLYRDYHRLNELLRKELHPQTLHMNWIANEIEEPDPAMWTHYHQELLNDLAEHTGCTKEDLEILDFNSILDFIDKAAAAACEEILAKRGGYKGLDPEDFFVPYDVP